MGAIMLGISVITGYLFTQRLRTSVDITNSTKAIFAADAGLEIQLYDIFRGINGTPGYLSTNPQIIRSSDVPSAQIPGGAEYESERTYNGSDGFVISSLGTEIVSRQLQLGVIVFGQ